MTAIERLKVRIPEEDNDNLLQEYLITAKDIIMSHLYPFTDDYSSLLFPAKYVTLQIDIAEELYNKRGAEGEIAHSENGVSRSYESAGVSTTLLNRITPYIGTLGNK